MLGIKSNNQLVNNNNNEAVILPLERCIAKTNGDKPGISVMTHCYITGLVARELIDQFPESIKSDLFPPGTDLLAACHDVGKVSPCFQKLLYQKLDGYENEKKILAPYDATLAGRDQVAFHGSVSQICLYQWHEELGKIVGLHHGFSPNIGYLQNDNNELFGGSPWQELRNSLIIQLKNCLGYKEDFIPHDMKMYQAEIIAGLITVADWIASGSYFENIGEDTLCNIDLHKLVKEAVVSAGFRPLPPIKQMDFSALFSFTWNPLQQKLAETAQKGPGIYVVEAPMGIGKTEAALFCAYTLLRDVKARGIYFALPTRLTSDKMYERMQDFINRLVPDQKQNVQLLHNLAWLYQTELGVDASPGGSWFTSAKRSILAPFAVGTIDQALMAVLNVKHSFVRTFGLAGKVVILDEVHSYDTYTGTIINRLIKELIPLHCTIIILSATLTARQKTELLETATSYYLPETAPYPLISAQYTNVQPVLNELFVDHGIQQKNVKVAYSDDTDMAIEKALEKADQGYQVLWVENTVAEAQDIFCTLKARCQHSNIDFGLLHSRFTVKERHEKEAIWVSLYGKKGIRERSSNGRILVGTQVLEQSLDIDSDFLISRLCPSDMILQRIGRLWRHDVLNGSRPKGASPELLLLGPKAENAIKEKDAFGSSGIIYSPYVLYRSLEQWYRCETIIIPEQIRKILEATYAEREESIPLIHQYKQNLIKIKEKLERLANVGLSRALQTLPEIQAQTRYSEENDTIQVLLVKAFTSNATGAKVTLLDDTELEIPSVSSDKSQRKEIASNLLVNCIQVSDRIAPIFNVNVANFKEYVFIGDCDEHPFRVAMLNRDGKITGLFGEAVHQRYNLSYSEELGYKYENL